MRVKYKMGREVYEGTKQWITKFKLEEKENPKNYCSFSTPFDYHIQKSLFHFPTVLRKGTSALEELRQKKKLEPRSLKRQPLSPEKRGFKKRWANRSWSGWKS